MKIIWSPAVTLDGNIATANGNSDWPSDVDGQQFHELIQTCGGVIVGRRTFDQYKGTVFPVDNATTFVWTTRSKPSSSLPGVTYVTGTPDQVVAFIEHSGLHTCVLAGGTTVNNAFMAAGLVDEINVTIYPLLLGKGMGLLTLEHFEGKLELIGSYQIGDGIIRNRYTVVKNK